VKELFAVYDILYVENCLKIHILPLDYATHKVLHLNPVNGRHTLMIHDWVYGQNNFEVGG
jgi:hypothetical protein